MKNRLNLLWIATLLITACSGTPGALIETATPAPTPFPTEAPSPTPDSSVMSKGALDACPVTRPPDPRFTPPSPYSKYPSAGEFWYGTPSLWTAVPGDGVWYALPHNPEGYTQKVFWWREGYSWTDEPEPQLTVTGRRLDAGEPSVREAQPLNVSKATNAFASDIGSAMLVGVDFPTLGCWEITGSYADADLSFVIEVAP